VQNSRVLNHFSLFSFTDAYWLLNEHAKQYFHEHWLAGLSVAATNFDMYQNTDSRADLLVWCAVNAEEPCAVSDFFERWATITTPYRHLIRPVDSLWGFTRPLQAPDAQPAPDIDPYSTTRSTYLVVYPSSKTTQWYRTSQQARKGAAGSEPAAGGQYADVRQLTLYSFGLEDQEFAVVYETDDLLTFSDLVNGLRDTQAPSLTLKETPVYTAIYHPAPQTLGLWK
jgi:chlorite dismutase